MRKKSQAYEQAQDPFAKKTADGRCWGDIRHDELLGLIEGGEIARALREYIDSRTPKQ